MKQTFIKGADISMLNEVEALGGEFFLEGQKKDIYDILRVKGINTIRLRLWVDPYSEEKKPYLGGTNDLRTTIELAKRAKKHGMQFMLNLHYSDFWTDPKKQCKPKAWKTLYGRDLENQVYNYTKEVLEACQENHIMPDFIQIGNEITNGMLWPDGKTPVYLFEERKFEEVGKDVKTKTYDQLARLLNAGIRAARECSPPDLLKVIIHLDFGGANNLYRTWFDEMSKREVDYDIIGLSYYPFWHGTLEELRFNLEDISTRYKKDILIVETAYGFTSENPPGEDSIFTQELAKHSGYPATVAGQKRFLSDLMKTVDQIQDHKGLGIVYWEPAWLPVKNTSWASLEGMKYGNDMAKTGNQWANQGLFDFSGNALDSLNVFKENGQFPN